MRINPYLHFSGNCAEAFKFYEEVLGGQRVQAITHGDTEARNYVDASWHGKIMHAHLKVGEFELMGTDVPPNMFQKPQGFSVSLQVSEVAEAERIFKALAEGGNTIMPIQETFWAVRFGMATDRFGTPWMINCDKPA